MIRTTGVRIWVATAPVDMRRGFDRLAEQVRTVLGEDPLSGHLFVFRSRSGERAKILWWDGPGSSAMGRQVLRSGRSAPTRPAPVLRVPAAFRRDRFVTMRSELPRGDLTAAP